jgi:hypothetical protein
MKAQHFESAGAPRVFVIHENDAWVEPLRREIAILGVPFSEWFLDEGMRAVAAHLTSLLTERYRPNSQPASAA